MAIDPFAAPYPKNIPLSTAEELVGAALSGRAAYAERVDLYTAAGRYSADDVILARPWPPFSQAAMDGFAVRYDELAARSALSVVGRAQAGSAYRGEAPPNSAVRVTTGAPMPQGYDTIIVDEHCMVSAAVLTPTAIPSRGANVRVVGEDAAPGTRLLTRGERIGPVQLALLAAAGVQPLRVYVPPRVAIVGLGSELTEPGQPCAKDHVYQCNNALLQSLIEQTGGVVQCRELLPDDPQKIAQALTTIAARADLIVTSGSVSSSEMDLLPPLLAEHGQVHFWQLQLKPGHPTLFGRWGDAPLFGLPGNIASVFSLFHALVAPALRLMATGHAQSPARQHMRLSRDLLKSHPRAEIQRGHWRIDANGNACVEPLANQQPHRLLSLKDVNALIYLPTGAQECRAGERVWVQCL